MAANEITLRVSRYRPDKDTEPGWQEYAVPLREEWTVLDGLNHLQERGRHDARLPLVLPDGHLRQLRDERQRGAEADLRDLPERLRTRAGRTWSRSPTSR